MQICKHPLRPNPILWYKPFSHSFLIVKQSLSNVAILTQEHDISGVDLIFLQIKVAHLGFALSFLTFQQCQNKLFHNARI